jgi:hypothetical protein
MSIDIIFMLCEYKERLKANEKRNNGLQDLSRRCGFGGDYGSEDI